MIADWELNCVYLAAMLQDRFPEVFRGIKQTLVSHGVVVRLLTNVRDYWARDYSPIQVAPGKLIKFRYEPDYLQDEPELRTCDEVVKSFRGLGRCRHSDINLDGGNVVASKTKAILTDKIYKENPGYCRSDLRDKLQELLQVDQLIVIPKEPYELFGHSDAMVRFIDEQAVLVNDYVPIDPDYSERLCKVLQRHQLAIETIPYFPEKRAKAGITSAVGCFANFLRTEKVLLAPVYGTRHDHAALRTLESVFPGLSIIPVNCTEQAREGGVLNCVSVSYRISQKSR
jgi:agmatine deiminase